MPVGRCRQNNNAPWFCNFASTLCAKLTIKRDRKSPPYSATGLTGPVHAGVREPVLSQDVSSGQNKVGLRAIQRGLRAVCDLGRFYLEVYQDVSVSQRGRRQRPEICPF